MLQSFGNCQIARLDTLAKEQSVRARTALSQATSIESQGATQHNTAYELLVILQERLAESRTSRDATLKILSDLRQDLMSPDNSIVVSTSINNIQVPVLYTYICANVWVPSTGTHQYISGEFINMGYFTTTCISVSIADIPGAR